MGEEEKGRERRERTGRGRKGREREREGKEGTRRGRERGCIWQYSRGRNKDKRKK